MKVGIASDFHFGFSEKTIRESDSFNSVREVFERFLTEDVDFAILPGDLFDTTVPSQETLCKAIDVFNILKKGKKSNVKIFKNNKEVNFYGMPAIAIHGTHEFRSKDYANILELMEKAGLLIYVHANEIRIERENEKVSVHGLGGIPEKKALNALQQWNPKPTQGAFNFLVFHQSITEYLPTNDEMAATISLTNLPDGFNIYLNGHLHWFNVTKLPNGGKFVLPGSTITTQMKRLESEQKKGFLVFDTLKNDFEFKELKNQRKFFYHKIKFNEASVSEVIEKVHEIVKKDFENNFEFEPLIRIKLVGTLAKGVKSTNINVDNALSEFNERAIFSITKKFNETQFMSNLKLLREQQIEKQNFSKIGFKILEENLKEANFNGFNAKRIFDLLENNETDKVFEILSEKHGE